jgi:RimJ/RimL family protein N-acetyltransferase
MEILRQHRLSESTILAEVDKFPEDLYSKQLSEWLMNEYPFLRWKEHLQEECTNQIKVLTENLKSAHKLRVGLFVNQELKGWAFGWQDSAESFYMGASAIAPDIRRQGYYSELVRYVLQRTKELGYQTVYSNHILTNNSVIIAKLKLGFTIKGIEMDAVHGTLLRLNYHHNGLMKAAARFRAGAIGESEVLKNLCPDF